MPYISTIRDLPDSYTRKMLDGLLNLIFPDSCMLCSIPLSRHRDCGICSGCWGKAVALAVEPPRCASCGLPFSNFEENKDTLCSRCILQMPPYSGARSFGHHTQELRLLIQGLKFQGRRHWAGLLASLLVHAFEDSWRREDFDLIVPVPLHPKRRRERGYNQSELLARRLASHIAVPYSRALLRKRHTPPQVGLTDSERRKNVRNAFVCNRKADIYKKRILLVDDVMTTGATVSSAAEALLLAGAWRVSVLTVARAEIR
jgi:ComF family protein